MSFAPRGRRGPRFQRKDFRSTWKVPGAREGMRYNPTPWTVDSAVRNGMDKVVWVFRAVHSIADAQARRPIVVRRGDPITGPIIPKHPLAVSLNGQPNTFESAYAFRYRLSTQILLSLMGSFIEMTGTQRSPDFWLHDPDRTRPIPDPDTFVSEFEVLLASGETDKLAPENVIWIKLPHPTDPYQGMTPLQAAGISVETAFLARIFNRQFLKNDGQPAAIITLKGEVDDKDVEEIETRFNQTTLGAGGVTVLEADDMEYAQLGSTMRDAQYTEGLESNRDEILGAFGVPVSIALGQATDSTFSNAGQEAINFWDNTMPGHLKLIASEFDKVDGSDDTFVAFDLSGIDALAERERADRKERADEFRFGAISLDRFNELDGQDTIGTPESQAHWLPIALVPAIAGNEIEQKALEAAVQRARKELGPYADPFRHVGIGGRIDVPDDLSGLPG